MFDLNSMLKAFLAQLTSKRLTAFLLLLVYYGVLAVYSSGEPSYDNYWVMLIKAVCFIAAPLVAFLTLVHSLTVQGGGDDSRAGTPPEGGVVGPQP